MPEFDVSVPTFDVAVPEDRLRILIIGAHMDDPDLRAGGTAAKYSALGHDVLFVSLTNGEAGHHEIGGIELTRRRRAEAQNSADVIGVEYVTYDIHEGELTPSIENRNKVIRLIREYEPDLAVTHRPNDYHPDHRYTADLVQDAAYMVTVPNICTGTPHLTYNPVIAHLPDDFQKPTPFDPDVVVPIDDVIDEKMAMLHCHESQMYEWLPYNIGKADEVPDDEEGRREWLRNRYLPEFAAVADRYRDLLIEQYGEERGREIQYAEAFEHCEYGGQLTDENKPVLFPFGL
jgi:N-acetylglucosamine malate deacetylase 1